MEPIQPVESDVSLEFVTMIPVYRHSRSGRITLTPSGPLLGANSEIPKDLSVAVFLYDIPAQARAAAETVKSLGLFDICEVQKLRSGEAAMLTYRTCEQSSGVVLTDMRRPDPSLQKATLSLHWKRSDAIRFFDSELDRCSDPYLRGKRLARLLGDSVNDAVTLTACQKIIESFPGARVAISAISSERIFEEIEDQILMADDGDDGDEPPSIFSIHHHLRCVLAQEGADRLTQEEVVDRVIGRVHYRRRNYA